MVKIAPSILSANLMHMHDEIQSIDKNGSEYIHIDVMDGHYVDNLTFGANMVKSIRPITQKVLDVHLMITPVKKYIDEYIKAGSDIISFHPEADNNSKEIIKHIKSANLKAGIAVHPRVSINEITEFLENLTQAQFTAIQKFFASMPKLTHEVKLTHPKTKKKGTVKLQGLRSFF